MPESQVAPDPPSPRLARGLPFPLPAGETLPIPTRRQGNATLIMAATLHRRAPSTYYGQWLDDLRGFRASNREANAQNETLREPLSTGFHALPDRARLARLMSERDARGPEAEEHERHWSGALPA